MEKITSLVMFSSGITSWAAAKRRAETHGTAGMVLLFADTKIEDEDNYRFLHESAENIGARLEIIADGRSPWEVMRHAKIIGNSRIDPCSKILKREILKKWQEKHCDPGATTIVFGIGWDEVHRIERVQLRQPDWKCAAPLCDKPWLSKRECLAWALRENVRPPRMYDMGFPHANCGGFCIKAGQASFALLLKNFPERYAMHEAEENSMREIVGDHSIMKQRVNGESKRLTMTELRLRIEAREPIDELDLGGCGCALPL